MPPKTRGAGDDNDAAEVIVTDETPEPAIVEGAENTPGSKLVRTRFRQDTFVVDDKTTLGGDWQEFPAKRAAELVALARRSNVDVIVTDKEN
jgi:hypothetical protein